MRSNETSPRLRPVIFLSSVFWEGSDEKQEALPLRLKLIERSHSLDVDLRAHAIKNGEPDNADRIIDSCFADIKKCDLFVYLQTRRHGSQVRYPQAHVTVTTYLEMELFAAAMLRKPVLVLHELGTEPEPALKDLLGLLEKNFGTSQYSLGDTAQLIDSFEQAVAALNGRQGSVEVRPATGIADGLSALRTLASPIGDLDTPALRFLGGWPAPLNALGDPDAARRLLDSVSEADAQIENTMSHGAALFRVWAAMREFFAFDRRDPEICLLWDRALGLWSTKASWFGIHGHVLMSPLAAVNSQIMLRQERTNLPFGIDSREPIGAKASALYSVAQRMETRSRQLLHFDQAILQASRAIEQDPDGSGGALSIRGHANLRVAKLGRLWRLFDARRDFAVSRTLRERAGASAAVIGQADAELGLAMILTAQPFQGMERLRHGIELLRSDQSPNGRAFLARGLRMLEQGARLTLRRTLAEDTRRERLMIAADVEAFGQMRDA